MKLSEYWVSRAHEVINPGYDAAISNYSMQKERFLKRLQTETQNEIENFMDNLNNQIANEADSELDATFDKAFDSIRDYLEEHIVSLMEDGNASYETLLTRFKNIINKSAEGKINPDRLYQNLSKDIEIFLTANNVNRSGLAQYVSSVTGLGHTNNTDVQNNLFGYARKLILQQLQGKELQYKIEHYKTSLKGYYKEETLVPALDKLLAQYGIKAKQMGSARNDSGQQIKYDIVLGSLNIKDASDQALTPLIKQMEDMSQEVSGDGEVQIQDMKLYGGLQSKSWIAPWSEKTKGGNRSFLSFGHNMALMPTGENAYYWHAGIYNVMNNLTEAIGPSNFIFGTGDTIYWTSDLLAKFKELQYVLAFYYNKTESKIISSNIIAQPHQNE
jgi:hypothetical protein